MRRVLMITLLIIMEIIITIKLDIQKQPPEVFSKKWPVTLFKKRLLHRCFRVNFEKFLRIPILRNASGCCFSICRVYYFYVQAYHSGNCKILFDESKTKIPEDIINPYTTERQMLLSPLGFKKEELAASVFYQMLLVLNIMEKDFDHRRKCLS